MFRLSHVAVAAAMLWHAPVIAQDVQPEEGTGRQASDAVRAENYMVAAANPLAVEAGYEILKAGGSAVDAMIAVQTVLNLVEPQSSGIGGGAFLIYYDAQRDEVIAYDGREMAPSAADGNLFLSPDGEPLGFWEAVVGGRSVGVPGTVKLLEVAHTNHGRLPWARLFERAIALSRTGFEASPRLVGSLAGDRGERLKTFDAARAYFFPGGEPLSVGQTVQNQAFAETHCRCRQREA